MDGDGEDRPEEIKILLCTSLLNNPDNQSIIPRIELKDLKGLFFKVLLSIS